MEMGATISIHHLVVTLTSEQPHKKQVKTLYMTQGFWILKGVCCTEGARKQDEMPAV